MMTGPKPSSLSGAPSLERSGVIVLTGCLAVVAAVLAGMVLDAALPPSRWASAILASDTAPMDAIVFAFAVLPRIAAALLAGSVLGLTGAVFQQVLRNPLTTPDTTGVTSGAQLALAIALLWWPEALAWSRSGIAFVGGLMTVALVLVLGLRSRLAPASLLLTGLAVTLTVTSLTTVLVLFNAHDLTGLLIWGGGSLAVQDWRPVATLALWSVPPAIALALLARPLALFTMDDRTVRALGGNVGIFRGASLVLAVALTAAVSGIFGAIGFVSLAAPTFARLSGVRRFGPTLAWSAGLGGLLLCATDNAALLLSGWLGLDVPTGAATALLGTPLLVGLAVTQRSGRALSPENPQGPRWGAPVVVLGTLAALLVVALCAALLVGRGVGGWMLTWPGPDLAPLLPWRAPRTIAAGAAGALLGLSGFLLQRVSGNPMAAPEMLGLSAGAGCGLLVATVAGADPGTQNAAAVIGAVAVALALLVWLAGRAVEPSRLLVTGLSLTAAVDSLVSVFASTGDPRALQVMTWMTGSTYRVESGAAAAATIAALFALPASLLATRWLDLMPLGAAVRRGLGLPEDQARGWLILFAAVLAGCGTLIVGPLSFVGLVAPRMAAGAGLRRAAAGAWDRCWSARSSWCWPTASGARSRSRGRSRPASSRHCSAARSSSSS